MKRYIFLTSVLALAACGAGSGGGGGTINTSQTTTISRPSTVTSEAAISNANITSMDSEILVADDGSLYVVSGGGIRSGSRPTVTYNGKTYTSYNLSDVKLFAADTTGTVNDIKPNLIMGLDANGRIEKITMNVGGVESDIARDSETTFRGPIFEYVPDGEDEAVFRMVDSGQTWEQLAATVLPDDVLTACAGGCHWNRVDERLDVQSNGDTVGLQYSDFGHFNPVYRTKHENLDSDILAAIREYDTQIEAALNANDSDALTALLTSSGLNRVDGSGNDLDKYRNNTELAAKLAKEDYQLMAGGYAIKNGEVLDTLPTPNSTEFHGKAIGRVYASIGSNDETVHESTRAAILGKYGYQNEDSDSPFYYQTTDSTASNYIMNVGHDEAKAFTADATLVVDESGNQTLTMPFADFYTVTATKSAGGVTDVQFDIPSAGTIAEAYRRETDNTAGTYAGTTGAPTQDFNPGYYGVNEASEAAGTVYFKEKTTGMGVTVGTESNTFKRDWEFQGAYGMTKDN